MGGRGKAKATGFFALMALVLCGLGSSARALPVDPCKQIPPAATDDGGKISVRPHTTQTANSVQLPRTWQREGKEIDISIVGLKTVDNAQVVVCFGWRIEGGTEEERKSLGAFVQSPTVIREATPPGSEKTTTTPQPVKYTATVPALGYPQKHEKSGDAAVVRAQNNTNPIADIRFLLFGNATEPAVTLFSSIGVVAADNYCDIPGLTTRTDNGIVVLSDRKNWQSAGGEFEFTINTTSPLPPDALIKVCYRWKLKGGDPGEFLDSRNPRLLDKQTRSIKIASRVPEIANPPSWFLKSRVADYAVLGIAVPRADVRILIFDRDDSPVVDVVTTVGITHPWVAVIVVFAVIGFAGFGLVGVCRKRLSPSHKANALLCIITSRRGFASLSQFQIVLWTFVVLTSSVYVMALSGSLIEITTGTLVLLGISGTAIVTSKVKSEQDAAKAPSVDPIATRQLATAAQIDADKLKAKAALLTGDEKKEADAAAQEAQAKADAAKATADAAEAVDAAMKKRATAINTADPAQKSTAEGEARKAESEADEKQQSMAKAAASAMQAIKVRHPRWSDLVMEETQGRELDVTRVQMVFFTLVTATFVLLTVVTTFEIPEIPQGFLYLMGISNSVYIGSKFANNADARS